MLVLPLMIPTSLFIYHYFGITFMLSPTSRIFIYTLTGVYKPHNGKKEEKDRNNLDLFSSYVCAISCRRGDLTKNNV